MTSLLEGHAVLWPKDHQIIDLGTVPGGTESLATSNNSRGQVVGFANNDVPDPFSLVGFPTQTRAFLWQNGAVQDLGTLGGPDALANNINDQGQIAGQSYTNSAANLTTGIPTQDPFLWEGGTMIDLGTLGGTLGVQTWLNNRGQVVGTMNLTGDVNKHGFLWERGSLVDLGTLGGNDSEANWMSDSGDIVGRADVPGSQSHHAFLWKNGVMSDLGVVSPVPCSTAISANSKGQVLSDTGICFVGGGPPGFSEHGQPMVDINTLVLPGSGLQVVETFDINNRGEIAGLAALPNGDVHAVVLVPASEAEIAAASAYPVAKAAPITKSPTPSTESRQTPSGMAAWRARLAQRYHIPGFRAASLYQSLHGPSAEANTTLAPTAADSGSGAPIIDGVDWLRDHSTTFSCTLTGHCDYICPQLRCPELTGWCSGPCAGGSIRANVRSVGRRGGPEGIVVMLTC